MPHVSRRQDPHDRRGDRRGPANGDRPRHGGLALRRYLAVGLGLFAVYAATLGIDSFGTSRYAGDEPQVLRAAKAIVDHGRLTTEPRDTPREVGLPLLIAPAYALGGPTLVELELAAFAALAFVLAVALARRLVPEPWATAAPVVCGLSPPALAYATAIDPVMVAGALLATAVVFALRARERPRLVEALGCGAALAVLPWLGTLFLVPAAVIGAVLFRWLWRRHRGWFGLVALEVLLASLVAFATVNERLFSRLTPVGDWTRLTGADSAVDYLDRAYRLVALWIDRDYGLLRWAPVFALAFVAVWLLWRSLRDRVARTLPERKDVEAAAGLLVLVCAAQVIVAAFLTPTMVGFWFPGRELIAVLPCAAALCAWGLRHAPRWVSAALVALTLVASVWLYVALRLGDTGWFAPTSNAPWGPLEVVFPEYGTDSPYATVVTAAVGVALLALVVNEWRQWRAMEDVARRAFRGA